MALDVIFRILSHFHSPPLKHFSKDKLFYQLESEECFDYRHT